MDMDGGVVRTASPTRSNTMAGPEIAGQQARLQTFLQKSMRVEELQLAKQRHGGAAVGGKAKGKRSSRSSRPASNGPDDLILSDEISQWIDGTLSERDENGLMPEHLGSVLTKPMDSMSVLCPTADLIYSKTTALRAPLVQSNNGTQNTSMNRSTGLIYTGEEGFAAPGDQENQQQNQYNNTEGFSSDLNISNIGTTFTSTNGLSNTNQFSFTQTASSAAADGDNAAPHQIDSAVSRMNVLWLKRKAYLEEQEGNLEGALKTWQKAIDEHIGDTDYSKAKNLSDPPMASDPYELVDKIEQNYFAYDISAHRIATRLQRWMQKKYLNRVAAATKVATLFRMFRCRKAFWKLMHTRTQCTTLIQRKFRKHLVKMNLLATLLKIWFKGQLALRGHRAKVRLQKTARMVQRIFRGYKGRQVYKRRKLRDNSARLIQRGFRRYFVRYARLWGIVRFHQVFFRAARTLQCWFRSLLSIKKSQRKILSEVLAEEERYHHEQKLVKTMTQLELVRLKWYFKTNPGQLHLREATLCIQARDRYFEKMKYRLFPKDILIHDASLAFELYDKDGSGTIDVEELYDMLRDLSLPIRKADMAQLIGTLDKDHTGEVDLNEFLDWYTNGGGGEIAKRADVTGKLFRGALRMKNYALAASGQSIVRRAKREVARQCCQWMTRDIRQLHRSQKPPKFQCCQCMKPFVMFMDYFMHFDKETGNCTTTEMKALFFPKYWSSLDWKRQRECETEIIRFRIEQSFVEHQQRIALYSDLATQKDKHVTKLMRMEIASSQRMYESLLSGSEEGGEVPPTCDLIMEIVDMCKDGFLNPIIARFVADCLGVSIPEDWIVQERWSMSEFRLWVKRLTQHLRAPVEDESSSNPLKKIKLTSCLPYLAIKKEAALLAKIFAGCLRLFLVGADTALLHLTELRRKRPRRVSIPDKALNEAGLGNLTKVAYGEVRESIVRRLRLLQMSKNKLYLETVQALTDFQVCMNGCFGRDGAYAQIGLDGVLDLVSLERLAVDDAHCRATASFNSLMAGDVGKMEIKSLEDELWAHQKAISERFSKGPLSRDVPYCLAELEYMFSVFGLLDPCKKRTARTYFSSYDVDLLIDYLLLKKDPKTKEAVKAFIDPMNGGFATFDFFKEFFTSQAYQKYLRFGYPVRKVARSVKYKVLSLVSGRPYSFTRDARIVMLIRMRHEFRLTFDMQRIIFANLMTMTEKQRIHYFDHHGVFKGQDSIPYKRLKAVRRRREQVEQYFIKLVVGGEAEQETKVKLQRSADGKKALYQEKLLLKCGSDILGGLGMIIPKSNTEGISVSNLQSVIHGLKPLSRNDVMQLMHTSYFKILSAIFDFDCTSMFDQEKAILLLRAIGITLPRRELLYRLPTIRNGSATLPQMIKIAMTPGTIAWKEAPDWYEIAKPDEIRHKYPVRPRGVAIAKPTHEVATTILTASARQESRDMVRESFDLLKHGKVHPKDRSGGISSRAYLWRSQLFAMRQTELFLKTAHGSYQHYLGMLACKNRWSNIVVKSDYSRSSILSYAVQLHCEYKGLARERVILPTEVPQIIRYLDLTFGLRVKEGSVHIVADAIVQYLLMGNKATSLHWFSASYLTGMLENCINTDFNHEEVRQRDTSAFAQDAIWTMNSRARQQAQVIAFNESGFQVSGSNYRCNILALDKVSIEVRESRVQIQESIDDIISREGFPLECLLLYMMYKGTEFEELMISTEEHENPQDFDFFNFGGNISIPSDLTSVKKSGKAFKRWAKVNLTPKHIRSSKLLHYFIALTNHFERVDAFKARWILELISGVSAGAM